LTTKHDRYKLTKWQTSVILALVCQVIFCLQAVAEEKYTVGEITLTNINIYDKGEIKETSILLNTFRKTINRFHFDTRKKVIKREILANTGCELQQVDLQETERNLRSLGFLINVSVTPIDTLPGNIVPIEVRYQEVWSTNIAFSMSISSDESRWATHLSDRNFLGYGISAGISHFEDEKRNTTSASFFNRRFLGSVWQVAAQKSSLTDGHSDSIYIGKPYLFQNDKWGAELMAWQMSSEPRYYFDKSGFDNYFINIPVVDEGIKLSATKLVRGYREGRLWRCGLGFELQSKKYIFVEDSELSDDVWKNEHGTVVLPHFLIHTEGRTWGKSKMVTKYGPVEDLALDYKLSLWVGPSRKQWGGTVNKWESELEFSNWDAIGDGFVTQRASVRAGSGYSDIQFLAGWFSHYSGNRHSRAVVELCRAENLVGDRAYELGLKRGLRTLGYDGMTGDRLVRWNIEHVILKRDELLGLAKVGIAGFCGGGSAWWNETQRKSFRNEAGFGLRFAPTRSANAEVARIDLSWDFAGSGEPVITAITRGMF
jgi:hypothetical protein